MGNSELPNISELLKVLIPCAVVVNCLWYYIKYVLRQNGYEAHLFRAHWDDIKNLRKLVENEQDESKKIQFKILLFTFYGVMASLVLVAIYLNIIWRK